MLAEYLNQHREHTLSMPGPWNRRTGPDARIVELNRKELRIRYEVKDKRYILAQEPFRKWIVARQQNYHEMIKWLQEKKIVLRKSQPLTLAAGTHMEGGQVYCVEVDGKHELLSGLSPLSVDEEKVVPIRGNR
jgi:hypothetical protein